jgi:photosystem II stability/assembly factor-like uncharacterized protein
MPHKVVVLLGTKKGAFLLHGDPARATWDLAGPYCETWPINHAVGNPATGAIHAAGGNEWFGPAVWTSHDLGQGWTHSSQGLAYAEGETPIKTVWSLAAAHGKLYAGVEPAGLFESTDAGQSFTPLDALRNHPTRAQWQMSGAGGTMLHGIVPHPEAPAKLWVAISAAGVFATEDAGASWQPRNVGTRQDYSPDKYPEVGQCVHCLALAPTMPDRLYQQNHCGMYRSDDGAQTWHSIEAGLPSTFGFPAAAHPRDADTAWLLPLNGDTAGRYVPDGRVAVWRTRDAGATWHDLRAGLPQRNAFFGVLRQAMATDTLDPVGLYFGTSSGMVFASRDEGETWQCIAQHLPTILSVETLVLDA